MYEVIGAVQTRTFRVLWTLEELGQSYRHVPSPPHGPAIVEANRVGKIPALRDGAHVLTDSVAIMSYLADKHAALGFAAGTIDRARQDALLHFANEELDSLLWVATKHARLLPEDRRVPAIIEAMKLEYRQSLTRLSMALTGPFLQGAQMTIADILVVHCLNWAVGAEFPQPDEKVAAYAKALRSRPAYKRVRALI